MQKLTEDANDWTLIIRASERWWDVPFAELWRYRDLVYLLVYRDFVSLYKQTVLGPIWFFIQPLFTTIVFTVIFSGVAKIPTDGMPPILFYLAGVVPWNYFSACLTKTSTTFVSNAAVFGKVYFPRLVVPISVVISNMIQFGIQFLLFAAVLGWYLVFTPEIQPNWGMALFVLPATLLIMAGLGLGAGILVSALTTKYRDFSFLLTFGIQLLMYATPVIYPVSQVPLRWRWVLDSNPMSAPIEAFRAVFLGGAIPWQGLVISLAVTFTILLVGVFAFNKVEKTFMDTV